MNRALSGALLGLLLSPLFPRLSWAQNSLLFATDSGAKPVELRWLVQGSPEAPSLTASFRLHKSADTLMFFWLAGPEAQALEVLQGGPELLSELDLLSSPLLHHQDAWDPCLFPGQLGHLPPTHPRGHLPIGPEYVISSWPQAEDKYSSPPQKQGRLAVKNKQELGALLKKHRVKISAEGEERLFAHLGQRGTIHFALFSGFKKGSWSFPLRLPKASTKIDVEGFRAQKPNYPAQKMEIFSQTNPDYRWASLDLHTVPLANYLILPKMVHKTPEDFLQALLRQSLRREEKHSLVLRFQSFHLGQLMHLSQYDHSLSRWTVDLAVHPQKSLQLRHQRMHKVIVPRWYSFERWKAPLQCGADAQYAARWQHHLNKVTRAYSLLTGRSMKVTQSLMEGD